MAERESEFIRLPDKPVDEVVDNVLIVQLSVRLIRNWIRPVKQFLGSRILLPQLMIHAVPAPVTSAPFAISATWPEVTVSSAPLTLNVRMHISFAHASFSVPKASYLAWFPKPLKFVPFFPTKLFFGCLP